MYNEIIVVCPETGKTVRVDCFQTCCLIVRAGGERLYKHDKTWIWGATSFYIRSPEEAKLIWQRYLLENPKTHWKDGF